MTTKTPPLSRKRALSALTTSATECIICYDMVSSVRRLPCFECTARICFACLVCMDNPRCPQCRRNLLWTHLLTPAFQAWARIHMKRVIAIHAGFRSQWNYVFTTTLHQYLQYVQIQMSMGMQLTPHTIAKNLRELVLQRIQVFFPRYWKTRQENNPHATVGLLCISFFIESLSCEWTWLLQNILHTCRPDCFDAPTHCTHGCTYSVPAFYPIRTQRATRAVFALALEGSGMLHNVMDIGSA